MALTGGAARLAVTAAPDRPTYGAGRKRSSVFPLASCSSRRR